MAAGPAQPRLAGLGGNRAAGAPASPHSSSWQWPAPPVALLHLVVLWSFAVVQPLFAELERSAEFFVARDNTSSDILLFAFALVLVPPAAMMLVELAARAIGEPLGRAVHLTFVGLLGAVFAIGLFKRLLPDTSAVLLPAAALAGAGIAVAYVRSGGVRLVITVLAVAPVVFLAGFLLFSPVSQLVTGKQSGGVASAATGDTPVVLVIFDELPTMSLMSAQRRIDADRVPSFAQLASSSTWYRNATTVADGTFVAVPAILTGRAPAARLPTSRSYPDSIFTLVGKRYDIHALEPITHVCPTALCGARKRDAAQTRLRSLVADLSVVAGHLMLPADIADSLPAVDRDYEDFGGEDEGVKASGAALTRSKAAIAGTDKFAERVREAERFVRNVRRPGRRPPLYMTHFEVPHVPWRMLPSGRQYPVPGPNLPGLKDQTWGDDAFLVGQATQRHMLQVGYADRLLGKFMRKLRAAGVWDRALVIVTADHGVGLRRRGSRRPVTRADFAGIGGVPLFVKLPGQRQAAIDDGPARTVDILPTVAAVTGAPRYPGITGTSLTERRPAVTPSVRNGRRGRLVSLDLATFVRQRDAELARQRALFPDPANLFRLSAGHGTLLGRAIGSPAADPGMKATIEESGAYRRVVFSSGVVPVYVSGRFTRGGQPGTPLAFAVNGRIRAVGRSYRIGSQVRFSAMLPVTSLRSGANTVTVLTARGGSLATIATTR